MFTFDKDNGGLVLNTLKFCFPDLFQPYFTTDRIANNQVILCG